MSFHRPVQSSKTISFDMVNGDDKMGGGNEDDDVDDGTLFETPGRDVTAVD